MMYEKKFVAILLVFTLFVFLASSLFNKIKGSNFPELSYLKQKDLAFTDIQTFFRDLAKKRGGEYAFNALKVAQVPPNTDIHLLGHAVGDILYKQQGINGIKVCTQDFRNACSHSIVVGLFIDKGVDAINDIANVCRSAPGGMGAYGMCFHGLGHGILAFTGYDMAKAVSLCEKTGTPQYGYIETSECVGGVMMEMISGVHDELAWSKQKDKYLKKDDPLFPCDQSFVPAVAKGNCFSYLTPHLWEAAGGSMDNPTEKDFMASFPFCSRLTGENTIYKESCYGGFGKEFIGLAEARDIRKTEQMTVEQLNKIYGWCTLAGDKFGISACIRQVVNSLYWGGENKPKTVITFCGLVTDPGIQKMCYEHIIGSFRFYQRPSRMLGLCGTLPSPYDKECRDKRFIESIE